MSKTKKQIVIDKIIKVVFLCIFLPFLLLFVISNSIAKCMEYIFEKVSSPLYHKICILIRKPIPNSAVYVRGNEYEYFTMISNEPLTIKEAKKIGKEYEDKGYEVDLYLSEF